jgi:hypothetical protein
VLRDHDPTGLMGTARVRKKGNRLEALINFAPAGVSKIADETYALVKAEILSAFRSDSRRSTAPARRRPKIHEMGIARNFHHCRAGESVGSGCSAALFPCRRGSRHFKPAFLDCLRAVAASIKPEVDAEMAKTVRAGP